MNLNKLFNRISPTNPKWLQSHDINYNITYRNNYSQTDVKNIKGTCFMNTFKTSLLYI